MDMSPAITKTPPPPIPSRPASSAKSCAVPKESCIDGTGVTTDAQQRVARALADAHIKLCAGERLVIDVRENTPFILEAPPRLGAADQRDLRSALRGQLLGARFTMKAEVRCRR
jgi:hypothetical protein